jgi:effector-binding domain-containing protein
MHMTEPAIETRPEQPCVAITRRTGMEQLATVIPPLLGEVFGWLGKAGIEPAGPPFFRYAVIDMAAEMEIAAGIPVAVAIAGDGEIESGIISAGRYVTASHTGHPAELMEATARLLAWAELTTSPGRGASTQTANIGTDASRSTSTGQTPNRT